MSSRRWRHVKRGSNYVELGRGHLQMSGSNLDMMPIVLYASETDGSLWARPIKEFEDGRFEEIPDNLPKLPTTRRSPWQPRLR